jgi:hypothetical protein
MKKTYFFQTFWEIYEPAFPFCERRSLEEQIRIFSNETYFLDVWIENETVQEFIGWWNCGGFAANRPAAKGKSH